jgi:predicted SnoaL-like aldol condensation-catalyzing enzyme
MESNKETVLNFYSTAFIEKDPEKALQEYVGDYYKQHNTVVPDGVLKRQRSFTVRMIIGEAIIQCSRLIFLDIHFGLGSPKVD